MLQKVNVRFEQQLDIRSFLRMKSTLVLLERLLLSTEQRLLFKFQQSRSLSLDQESCSSEDSADLGKPECAESLKSKFAKIAGFRA